MARRDTGTDDPRVKIRASKHSRPRTKIRPKHENATKCMVIGVDRGRFQLVVLDNDTRVSAIKAREIARGSIVIGDIVGAVGDLSGKKDTLARIVKIFDRKTQLMRSSEEANREKTIVANADLMVIVVALANPEPKLGMIDRCIVAAYNANMTPVLCLTKADLGSPDEFMNFYSPLGIGSFVTQITDTQVIGIEQLKTFLEGKVSVFVGHSGVGKSTLINALIPEAKRATGDVNAVTGKGRHTSTSAVALELQNGGWVVDTPGVRSFGLAHLSVDNVICAFEDLHDLVQKCPKGCKHTASESGCCLNKVGDEKLQIRIDSLRRILSSKDIH